MSGGAQWPQQRRSSIKLASGWQCTAAHCLQDSSGASCNAVLSKQLEQQTTGARSTITQLSNCISGSSSWGGKGLE